MGEEFLARIDIAKLDLKNPAELDFLVEMRRKGATFEELKNLIGAWRNGTVPAPN